MKQINEYLFGSGIQSVEVPLNKSASEVVRPAPKKKQKEVAVKESSYEPLPEYIHKVAAVYSKPGEGKIHDVFHVKSPIKYPFGAQDIVKKKLSDEGYNIHSIEHKGKRIAE